MSLASRWASTGPAPTGDLLLCNNVESRSNWPRTSLTAAISRDEGEPRAHFCNVADEALVTYYTRSTKWARDSEVMLKVFKISQFYD